jgi:hypothetical protein
VGVKKARGVHGAGAVQRLEDLARRLALEPAHVERQVGE